MDKKLNYDEPIKNFTDEEISKFINDKLKLIVGQIMHFDDNIQIVCYSKLDQINVVLKDYTAFAMINRSPLTKDDMSFMNEIPQRWQGFIFAKLGKPYLKALQDYNNNKEQSLSINN